ncbi:MAG: hypothetical protein CR982_09995 [Candidatus Cloacimonadota bacterium]|nr:MAG: hypothetical protein CR982_09995 [Candidatus Cloacimonadota bacterium]PIE81633.1 MAG: hypothetical protein CSA15_00485 [Candidatus Delongbacteria bacterium]
MKKIHLLLIIIPVLLYFIFGLYKEKTPNSIVEKRLFEPFENIVLVDTIPKNKFLRIDRDVALIDSLKGYSFKDSLTLDFKTSKYIMFKLVSKEKPVLDSSRVEITINGKRHPLFFNYKREVVGGLFVKGKLNFEIKNLDMVTIRNITQYSVIRKDWRNRKRTDLVFLYVDGDSIDIDNSFTKINRFIERDDEYLFGNRESVVKKDSIIEKFLNKNSILNQTKLKTIFFSNNRKPISHYDEIFCDSLDIYESYTEFSQIVKVHKKSEHLLVVKLDLNNYKKSDQNEFFKKAISLISKYKNSYTIVKRGSSDWILNNGKLKSKFRLKEVLYKKFNMKMDKFTSKIYDFKNKYNLSFLNGAKHISNDSLNFMRKKGNYFLTGSNGKRRKVVNEEFLNLVDIINRAPERFKIVFELQDDNSSLLTFSKSVLNSEGKLIRKSKLRKGKNIFYLSSLENSISISSKSIQEVYYGFPPMLLGKDKRIKFKLFNDIENSDNFKKNNFHIYILDL